MATSSNDIQVGTVKTWSPYDNVPTYQWQQWPTYSYNVVQAPTDYANEIEIERREHDAVLTFWRNGPKNAKQRIAQITVPLSVLEQMSDA